MSRTLWTRCVGFAVHRAVCRRAPRACRLSSLASSLTHAFCARSPLHLPILLTLRAQSLSASPPSPPAPLGALPLPWQRLLRQDGCAAHRGGQDINLRDALYSPGRSENEREGKKERARARVCMVDRCDAGVERASDSVGTHTSAAPCPPTHNSPHHYTLHSASFHAQCIKRCAREGATRDEGWKILFKHASSKMLLPGHADWPLPQYIFGEGSERDTLKSYFKQLRMGVIDELVHKLYDAETGEQNKWWMSFQGRKFMGMELLN